MENSYPVSGVNSNWAYPILEPADIETRFLELAQQWRRETGMMSLVTKMSMHPAYQRIIGMGRTRCPPNFEGIRTGTGTLVLGIASDYRG